jgi:acyl carrier protein phosphodiesterase
MDSKKQTKTAKEQNSKDIIYRYLKSRNIDGFKMTGMLSIEGRVVNVNFQLKDKNIMITYWDLDEVQSLLQQPGYRRIYLERHEKEWKNLCSKYTQAGGKIYPITSADEKEILAKLTLCSELNGG